MNNDLKNADDVSLVENYRAGNEDAFDVLYDRYKSKIRIVCRPYYLWWGDSEDVVQVGLIGFLRAVNTYNVGGGASFWTYAVTCIKAKVFTAIKSSLPNGKDGEGSEEIIPASDDIEGIVLIREMIAAIMSGLDGELSEFEAEVLKMYIIGFGYEQISAKTGKSYKAVDNALQRAKKKIERYKGTTD